jgi:predicted transcriptional regulator
MNTTKHVTARVDRDTAERLARRAVEEERSQSSVIRRALRTYLAPRGRHAPKQEVAA